MFDNVCNKLRVVPKIIRLSDIVYYVNFIVSEFEIQSLRESDCKRKKKKHQEKKKKKKNLHTEDTTTSGGDSLASDTDKESDDVKSRDGYSSPDTGNFTLNNLKQLTYIYDLLNISANKIIFLLISKYY